MCLKACVEAGANVEAMSNKGNTAIMNATARGDLDAVRLLLRNGASLTTLRGEALETRLASVTCISARWARGVAFVDSLHAAGGWNRYVQKTWFALVKLRRLCVEGRATVKPEARPLDPSMLAAVKLLGAQAEDPSRLARHRAASPVPPEIFRHIVEYWWWG